MKKNVQGLDAKLESPATEAKLTEVSKENSANIQEQRKAAAAAAAAAVTSPPTAPSASALSRPLKAVRQRNSFTVCISKDQKKPVINGVQLLPGGKVLLADRINVCVQLFDTQGQHLHIMECRSPPCLLAVLDSSSIRHAVAVTLPFCSGIDLLEVTGDNMKVKRTLQTSRGYDAVAAVNNQTLAVGCWRAFGIDLIDLGGQVLRQICSSVHPNYMVTTEDGHLMCSTYDDTIAQVQMDTGTIVFDKSVPQIQDPRGVAITSDGSILVTDGRNKTLHLVSSQGAWIRQLWSEPSDIDKGGRLQCVSTDGCICVCVTGHGSVYIFDCV
ncbi:hypothetical protein PoB_000008600 [Plakobranchus ocellatus]|uniref:Uncharacterized protein n=1 Tax=Plakobranchus ocellatus TaxID=259542 RepID=A0AAV3WRG3_9GAST|nr:hypothetical protein PoB_000008600 [Plakobranchus ocellatus]